MIHLHPFVVVLSIVASGGAAGPELNTDWERPQGLVAMERPGMPPMMVPGSEEMVAREELKGVWQVVTVEHQGDPRPDLAAGLRMRFSLGKLELIQEGRQTIVVNYRPVYGDIPRQFAWVLWQNGRVRMQRGVYCLEEDALALCVGPVNGNRATQLLTEPQDGRTLYVLQRVGE